MSAKVETGSMIIAAKNVTSFNTSGLKSVDSVAVGNLTAYNALKGDAEVYEFINEVKLGEDNKAQLDAWTDIVLTTEWAQSFSDAVNATPKPLFIKGHAEFSVSGKERVIPDGYVTGGLVLNDTLYLRNTLIKSGAEDKLALIEQTKNEIIAGMLSTSTYDYMKYTIERDEETYDATYFAIESVKAQSNALVEVDQTGSDAAIILTSFKAGDGREDEKEQGEKHMSEKVTNEQRFLSLKNQIEAGTLSLKDVAEQLGLEVKTSSEKLALKRLSDAENVLGPLDVYLDKLKAEKESTFTALKESKLKETFKTDELYELAEGLFSLKEGDAAAISTEVERVAGLKVFEKLQGQLAGSINASFGASDTNNIVTDDGEMEG